MSVDERLLSDRYRFSDQVTVPELTDTQADARRRFLSEIHAPARYVSVTVCPFCGGRDFLKISEVEHRGLPADIVICQACDGCFKSVVLDPHAATFHYEQLSYALRGKGLSESARAKLFRIRVETIAWPRCRFIQHFLGLRPGDGAVVELGCNDGANLAPWCAQGFDALGMDLDEQVVAFGAAQGLPLVRDDVLQCAHPMLRSTKLVMLSHVLEHVSDVHATLERVGELMGREGFAFIEVPGIRGQALINPLQYFEVEHNFNFDLATLTRVFDQHGLRLLYGDEFIRAIVFRKDRQGAVPRSQLPWSAQALMARAVGLGLRLAQPTPRPLYQTLREGEVRTVRARLINKLSNGYFRFLYASLSGEGAANGRRSFS